MGWRTVVISGRAKLDLKLNNLVVRKEETQKINISEIELLIIDSTTVSITTALLSELARQKVKTIFCDEKHNPFGEIATYYSRHNTSLMVKKQIEWSKEIKESVWTIIVEEKIRKQAQVLDRFHKAGGNLLRSYISELEIGDKTNREGHAAKVYFNSLFGLDFKRDAEDPINAALNYGYSILLSIFNREVLSNGYITQLGLFHDNQFNQFNLSSDLMEPFRPIVDISVYSLNHETFDTESKMKLIEMTQSKIYIDNKLCTLQNGISIYCRGIFESLEHNNTQFIKMFSLEN